MHKATPGTVSSPCACSVFLKLRLRVHIYILKYIFSSLRGCVEIDCKIN